MMSIFVLRSVDQLDNGSHICFSFSAFPLLLNFVMLITTFSIGEVDHRQLYTYLLLKLSRTCALAGPPSRGGMQNTGPNPYI